MQTNVQVTELRDSAYDIGRKQWALIEDLRARYERANPSLFLHNESIFDDVWHLKDGKKASFRFEEHFPEEMHHPLKVFIQVMCYELINNNGFAVNTVIEYLGSFCHSFIKDLQDVGVLTAQKNQPFRLFSTIDETFITNKFQRLIAKENKAPVGALYFFNMLKLLQHEHLKLFISSISLPWVLEDIPVEKWRAQQQQIMGIVLGESSFHAPLHFETVSTVVQYSIPIVEEYHDTLCGLFECVAEAASSFSGSKRSRLKSAKKSPAVARYVEKHRDDLEKILPIRYVKTNKHNEHHEVRSVLESWVTDIFRLTQSACCWVVLLTTGIRNVDMRNLVVGCCHPSKNHEHLWWLVADVKKTKNRLVLPVGKSTYLATKLLEKARFFDSPFLVTNYRHYDETPYGEVKREYKEDELYKLRTASTFNSLLKFLPDAYKFTIPTIFKDEATAHCIRATLAGYVAENSNAAILILKRLFGHSNMLMPDEYIRRNPLIIKKREELQNKIQQEIARDLAKAVVNQEVSGKFGESLLKGVSAVREEIENEARLKNVSLTEIDLLQSLEERFYQLFIEDIANGETYALMTPMSVVCMRASNNTGDSPCASQSNKDARTDSNIKKAITDALMSLPNPAQCVGITCNDALLGKKWSRRLLESFDFFLKYRRSVDPSLEIKEEAEAFVKVYAEPLKKIYADEREEGYFSVN